MQTGKREVNHAPGQWRISKHGRRTGNHPTGRLDSESYGVMVVWRLEARRLEARVAGGDSRRLEEPVIVAQTTLLPNPSHSCTSNKICIALEDFDASRHCNAYARLAQNNTCITILHPDGRSRGEHSTSRLKRSEIRACIMNCPLQLQGCCHE